MKHDLHYHLHDGSSEFRFQLSGRLSHGGARDLERAWSTASSVIDGKCLIVDLSQVTSVDASGCELLDKWHAQGARLVVTSSEAQARIQVMTGVAITLLDPAPNPSTWLRFRAATPCLVALFVFLFPAIAA
jgi:anti-anti-sigma regulatory factor